MPTYDYECKECGKTLEIFQKMSEAPLKKCPACGKLKLQRLMGPGAGLLFKGSGFYITDNRSAAYKAQEKAESEGASKSSPPGSASSPPPSSPPSPPTGAKESTKSDKEKP